jgi:hypothetical protein
MGYWCSPAIETQTKASAKPKRATLPEMPSLFRKSLRGCEPQSKRQFHPRVFKNIPCGFPELISSSSGLVEDGIAQLGRATHSREAIRG